MGDVVQANTARGARGAGLARGARRDWGAIAPALALACCALVASCTSSKPARVVEAAPAHAVQPAASSTSAGPAIQIRDLELREGAPEVFVELQASAPLVWTSFRNAQGQVVLELPNSTPTAAVVDLAPEDGLVSSVKVERPTEGSRPMTRLVIATRQDVEHSVTADGNTLKLRLVPVEPDSQRAALTFEPVNSPGSQTGETVTESAHVVDSAAPAPAAAESAASQTSAESTAAAEPAARAEAAEPSAVPEPAHPAAASAGAASIGTVDRPAVGPAPSGARATRLDEVAVLNAGSGAVVRLSGDGEFPYSTFMLEAPPRFVLDLAGVVNRSPRPTLAVASEVVERVRVGQFKPMPNAVARVVFDLRRDSVPAIERSGDALVVRFSGDGSTASSMDGSADEPAPAPVRPQPQAHLAQLAPPPPPPPPPAPRATAPQGIEVEEAPLAAPARPPAAPARPMAAPAAPQPSDLQLQRSPSSSAAAPENPAVAGLRQSEERTYFGEPIDLKVTNADVTDVLRTFAQLSGLNIIVQPGVTGTVTAEMENVPWDQAFEQVLKINKLDYVREGNVVRIAPVSVLRQEAQERQELAQAQALAIPLSTVMKRLNYANAQEIASLMRQGTTGLLSQRGSVIVDQRTNTLIIKELPNFMDTVVGVVEMLDTPEPQVMIEARIIETTKRFSRDLGIRWGFNAIADAAHGNTTGLVFPNNADVSGSVEVGGSTNDLLNIRLGNVLNTFTLDVALQALESEGLIHILSAPKVATLNNQKAEIQSGLQIPVQTIANNTVTVQFVNATLRLDVTPQVTADGTVVMDIDISKREPLQAFLVPGANNAPISTKDARTRLVVRDGGTAVIGGIYKLTTDEGQDRIPGLANIPILGYLFKNKSRSETNEELLIFITPRVIKL